MSNDTDVESIDDPSDPPDADDGADLTDEALDLKVRPAEFFVGP